MKVLYQFFTLPLYTTILFVSLAACEKKVPDEPIKTIEPVKTDSLRPEKNIREIKQEIEKPVLDTIQSPADSMYIDSVNISGESIPDSTETMAQPLRKPTFKHFYKYMKLHNRGPIV